LETIYALSSAGGRAGVAVIRVSGPRVIKVIEALTGRAAPRPREAALRALVDPASGVALDRALVLFFRGPESFTGEDVAEFHVHGGRAVVASVLGALGGIEGLRTALPGEFTRRAFENDKLDLTEAEGLGDLIDAETEGQRRQALRQMEGALGRLYEGWRQRLIRVLAHAEADIDFADEDLPDELTATLGPKIGALAAEIQTHLDDGHRGERLRDGVEVAIIGPPNVGKSSLLNRLAGREAAIVSDEAGTTRDVLEVRLDLGGVPVTLADTAGLREAEGRVEREGISRARARAESADLRLVMVAGGSATLTWRGWGISESSTRPTGWRGASLTQGKAWSAFIASRR
jgi:tRNA modification GTPase